MFSLAMLAGLGIASYGAFLFGPIQWHYLLVKYYQDVVRISGLGALSSAKTRLRSTFPGKGSCYLEERVCKFRES